MLWGKTHRGAVAGLPRVSEIPPLPGVPTTPAPSPPRPPTRWTPRWRWCRRRERGHRCSRSRATPARCRCPGTRRARDSRPSTTRARRSPRRRWRPGLNSERMSPPPCAVAPWAKYQFGGGRRRARRHAPSEWALDRLRHCDATTVEHDRRRHEARRSRAGPPPRPPGRRWARSATRCGPRSTVRAAARPAATAGTAVSVPCTGRRPALVSTMVAGAPPWAPLPPAQNHAEDSVPRAWARRAVSTARHRLDADRPRGPRA